MALATQKRTTRNQIDLSMGWRNGIASEIELA